MKRAQELPWLATKGKGLNTLVIRLVLFSILAGSLGLTFWSINRLLSLQAQSKALNLTFSRLSLEADRMQARWTPATVELLLGRYSQLSPQLFTGQDALMAWLKDFRQQLGPLALEAKTEFGQTALSPTPDKKVTTIPATVTIQVKPAAGLEPRSSPFQRVLRLTQYLGAGVERADLVELEVSGASNSVNRAVATLNFWVGEPGP
jgi:hypothetical protein